MSAHPLADPRPSAALFLAVAVAVYAAELGVVRTPAFAGRPDLLAFGVAVDLVLVVPLAYWWLVVRRGAASLRTVLPVLALSVLGARLVLPAGHHSFVGLIRYATIPVEITLLGYGVRSARRALRAAGVQHGTDPAGAAPATAPDAAEALEHAFVAALGDRAVARVVAAEVATLYYALIARASVGAGARDVPARAPPSRTAWGCSRKCSRRSARGRRR